MDLTRRHFFGLGLATAALGLRAGKARAASPDVWPDIREALFADRPIADAAGVIRLEAPVRAYDAAIVPLTVTADIPQTAERAIRTVHLVVDQNPAPVAGVFHFTADSGSASFATRVRVNEYTNIRAIAETSDGKLHMATRFVKAAGGCSAPALKDQGKALAQLGRMKLKQADAAILDQPNRAQLLISHPQYSGMQFDQITRNYIPAHFIDKIEISYADRPVLTVDSDISLSEDPSIHFFYVPHGPGALRAAARDSKGEKFAQSWPVQPVPAS